MRHRGKEGDVVRGFCKLPENLRRHECSLYGYGQGLELCLVSRQRRQGDRDISRQQNSLKLQIQNQLADVLSVNKNPPRRLERGNDVYASSSSFTFDKAQTSLVLFSLNHDLSVADDIDALSCWLLSELATLQVIPNTTLNFLNSLNLINACWFSL